MEERKEEIEKTPEGRREEEAGRPEAPPTAPRRGGRGWFLVLFVVVVALAGAVAWFSIQWKQAQEEARKAQERIRAMCLQGVASAAVDLEKAAAQAKALNFGEALARIERASRKIRDATALGDEEVKSRLVNIQSELNKLPEEVRKEIKRAAERAAARIAELAKKVKQVSASGPPVKVEVR